jgi:hypothetical protein
MSGFKGPFAGMRATIREKVGLGPSKGEDANEESEENSEIEKEKCVKNERKIQILLRHARSLFLQRKLIGEINICITWGMTANYVNVEVSEEDYKAVEESEEERPSNGSISGANEDANAISENSTEEEKLGYVAKLAIKAMGHMIKNLEWRATPYEHTSYKPSMTLCRNITIAPPVPITIFSISIYFYATVISLLESREQRALEQAAKQAAKQAEKTAAANSK